MSGVGSGKSGRVLVKLVGVFAMLSGVLVTGVWILAGFSILADIMMNVEPVPLRIQLYQI